MGRTWNYGNYSNTVLLWHMADRQQYFCIFDAIGQDKDSAHFSITCLTFWKNDLQNILMLGIMFLVPFLHLHRFNLAVISTFTASRHDTMRVLAKRLPLLNGNGTSFCKTFARMIDEHTSFEDEVLFQNGGNDWSRTRPGKAGTGYEACSGDR